MAVKNNPTKENELVENGKKKGKEERPATKVVVRRLPPSMTEEQFKMQVSPLPEIDYFYFVTADMSLMPNAFCRAYINFVDQSDLFIFTQKFDGYVFLDSKGGEFPAVVEFAPFQRIPKNRPNRKKDPKVGTIESDPVFIAFKERLEAENLENKMTTNAAKQHFFETSLVPEKKENNNTPLLDFIKNKRAERQRIRDEKREEKRKKELERKRAKERTKKEDETSVVKRSSSPVIKPKSKLPDPTLNSLEIERYLKNENQSIKEINNQAPETLCNITEKQVPAKVQELVNFFNKQNKYLEKVNCPTIPPQNYAKLKDVEIEIIKSSLIENTELKKSNCEDNLKVANPKNGRIQTEIVTPSSLPQNKSAFSKASMPNYLHMLSFPVSSYQFNESKSITDDCCNTIPEIGLCDRRSVPGPVRSNAHQNGDIIMKPIRIAIPEYSHVSKAPHPKIDNAIKNWSKTNFDEDVLRKNLQKVVQDVLGNSKVQNPKQNVISRPKTFMKRVLIGSGEPCARSGFNSPNFYLPPRSFGCGPMEPSQPTFKRDSSHSTKVEQPKPFKTISSETGHLPTFSKKTLPPFSKKSIFSSKSEGDIKKPEHDIKMGGSDESFKRKNSPWAFEIKHDFARRPNVAPK